VVAGRRRWVGALVLPVLVVTAMASAAANRAYHERSAGGRYPYLHDRIAQEMADFDRTPTGDGRRCMLRAQFAATSAPGNLMRIDRILDRAARQIAGRRWCTQSPQWNVTGPLYRPMSD